MKSHYHAQNFEAFARGYLCVSGALDWKEKERVGLLLISYIVILYKIREKSYLLKKKREKSY